MGQADLDVLKSLARKTIWCKTPEEAITLPDRVIAQVMQLRDFDDIQLLAGCVGHSVLGDVLTHAGAGQFDERSWACWQYRLGLAELEQVPPLPRRSFQ